MMKTELTIFGFFLLVMASWMAGDLAFAAINKPSTVGFIVGWFVIVLLVLLWASVFYKIYQRVLLPYLNKVEPKKNEETKSDEKPVSGIQ